MNEQQTLTGVEAEEPQKKKRKYTPKPPTEKATYELYDGKALLKYMEKGRSHWYEVRGQRMPSVTKVCAHGDSPDPLIYWAVNCMAERLQETVPVGKVLDEIEKEELINSAKYAFRDEQRKALGIGGNVHDWIEAHINMLIKGQPDNRKLPINEEMRSCVEAFLRWEKETGVVYEFSERKVLSLEYGYAGTLDIGCRFPSAGDRRGIIDMKTSKAIYENYYLQVSAYRQAIEEETGQEFPESHIVRIPKDGGDIEIKHLNEEIQKTAFDAFVGKLVAYNNAQKLKGLI